MVQLKINQYCRQAIIWTRSGLVYRDMHSSLGLNDLNNEFMFVCWQTGWIATLSIFSTFSD